MNLLEVKGLLAEITTQFHAADALMDKYITLLENYEKDGRKTHRSEFFAIRTQITKICTDIAVRILINTWRWRSL